MDKFTSATDRITDLTWEQVTQFVNRLGLTGSDVKKLLDNPKLLTKVAEATKSHLAEPIWDRGQYFIPSEYWYLIAPGVQIKRPEGYCSCCANPNHILVRTEHQSARTFCDPYWSEATLVHLSDSWANVAPDVQVRKCFNGISVHTLKVS